jgi:coenzyme F420-0:L-glutamate ligase/coenzyme F420-1:gamma-L-glutamate ligase
MVDELPSQELRVELIASPHIGLIQEGDDLPAIIVQSFVKDGVRFRDGDVVVIAQKIVSKAEGRYAYLSDVKPSNKARELAAICEKDSCLVELILRESREVLRCVRNVIVVENCHGVVLANAGIDRSNVEQTDRRERVLLLPKDPDASAAAMRDSLRTLTGTSIGVVISDSIGRAWRMGTIGTAIGVSGLTALQDKRGEPDLFGFRLRTTEVAHADEIAAAASLLMGQSDEGTPVVLIRNLRRSAASGQATDMIRPRKQDLFR